MVNSDKKVTIGIFGHYGNENLGDEAIIQAVIQNLRRRLKNADLVLFSVNPADSARRYNLPAFPIRNIPQPRTTHHEQVHALFNTANAPNPGHSTKAEVASRQTESTSSIKTFLKNIPVLGVLLKTAINMPDYVRKIFKEVAFLLKSHKTLRPVDLLLVTGSNQFLDNFGGTWGFPYTLFKWSLLAKLARTKLAFVSVGAGPLDAKLSHYLVRGATAFSSYVSFRDEGSQALMQRIGFRKQSNVFPDLAHSLIVDDIPKPHPKESSGKEAANHLTIAVNLMPIYDGRYWCEPDDNKYTAYIEKMSEFCAKLIAEKYNIFFFATQPKDEYTIRDVLKTLRSNYSIDLEDDDATIQNCTTLDTLLETINRADLCIPTRFHGIVLSLLMGKPTLGICYHIKSRELLANMNYGEYGVDIDTFSTEELERKFNDLRADMNGKLDGMNDRKRQIRGELDLQYDTLARLALS